MKTFMAVYTGNPAAMEQYRQRFPDPGERKRVTKTGIADIRNNLAGYTIECLPIPARP